jgi:hypothetical protein
MEELGGCDLPYGPLKYEWAEDKSFDEHCDENHFDDMAYLWMADREEALKAVNRVGWKAVNRVEWKAVNPVEWKAVNPVGWKAVNPVEWKAVNPVG